MRRVHLKIWPLEWSFTPWSRSYGGEWHGYFLCFELAVMRSR